MDLVFFTIAPILLPPNPSFAAPVHAEHARFAPTSGVPLGPAGKEESVAACILVYIDIAASPLPSFDREFPCRANIR